METSKENLYDDVPFPCLPFLNRASTYTRYYINLPLFKLMPSDVSMILPSLSRQSDCFIMIWIWVKTDNRHFVSLWSCKKLSADRVSCMFKVGLRSLIISISWIKQSNLFRHFFSRIFSDFKESRKMRKFDFAKISYNKLQSIYFSYHHCF